MSQRAPLLANQWESELSEYLDLGMHQSAILLAVAHIIMRAPGCEEALSDFPKKVQSEFLTLLCKEDYSAGDLLDMSKIREIANFPGFIEIDESYYQLPTFERHMRRASSTNRIYNSVSSEFKNAMIEIENSVSEHVGRAAYMSDVDRYKYLVLRSVYGEECLIEVIRRCTVELETRYLSAPSLLIPLLKNWINLKNYPLSWAVHVPLERREYSKQKEDSTCAQ